MYVTGVPVCRTSAFKEVPEDTQDVYYKESEAISMHILNSVALNIRNPFRHMFSSPFRHDIYQKTKRRQDIVNKNYSY